LAWKSTSSSSPERKSSGGCSTRFGRSAEHQRLPVCSACPELSRPQQTRRRNWLCVPRFALNCTVHDHFALRPGKTISTRTAQGLPNLANNEIAARHRWLARSRSWRRQKNASASTRLHLEEERRKKSSRRLRASALKAYIELNNRVAARPSAKSSPSRTCARAPKRPTPIFTRCARSCLNTGVTIATWKKARSGATPT